MANEWHVAYKYMLRAAESSGLPSSEDGATGGPPKRKRHPTKRFLDTSDDGACPVKIRKQTPDVPIPMPMQRIPSSTVEIDPTVETGDQLQGSTPGNATSFESILDLHNSNHQESDLLPSNAAYCTSTPAKLLNVASSSSSVDSCEVSLLKDMKLQLSQMQLQLNQIKDIMKGQQDNNHTKRPHSPVLLEDVIENPCETLLQLERLEDDLNSGKYKKSELGVGGGQGQLSQTVKSMMTSIAVRDVWKSFSLMGQKSKNGQKMGFHKMTLYKTVRRACRLAHPQITNPEKRIKDRVARYLTVIRSCKDDDKEERSDPVTVESDTDVSDTETLCLADTL